MTRIVSAQVRFFYFSLDDARATLTARSRTLQTGSEDALLWLRGNSHSYDWQRAEVTFSSSVNSKVSEEAAEHFSQPVIGLVHSTLSETAAAGGVMCFWWSVRSILVNAISQKHREPIICVSFWNKRPLALEDKLIRIWWSKVSGAS